MATLEQVIANVEKRFSKGIVQNFEDGIKDIELVSSGSIGLDRALGGGYPKGRIIEIYGSESSGKTTTALQLAVEIQKLPKGNMVLYIDYENAIDPVYCQSIGIDFSKNKWLLSTPQTTEDGIEIIREFVKVDSIGLIIVDSVAAMVPKAEMDGESGDSKMGLQARAMSQGLRLLVNSVNTSNCIVVFINQTRDKIGISFGDPTTTTGGNALKFYASQRLAITKSGQDKDKEGAVVSINSKITIKKNKVAPPFCTALVPIKFGEGFDKFKELVDIAVELDIIKKSGSWFSYGDTKLGQGSEGVINIMRDNIELFEEIDHKVRVNLGLAE